MVAEAHLFESFRKEKIQWYCDVVVSSPFKYHIVIVTELPSQNPLVPLYCRGLLSFRVPHYRRQRRTLIIILRQNPVVPRSEYLTVMLIIFYDLRPQIGT
jgi:hypothetical protein